MANFMGGSAPTMATQIADGLSTVNANSFRGFLAGDFNLLRQELDKLQREARATTAPADDAQAQQSRSRRITRISSALHMLAAAQMKLGRG